MLVFGAEVPPRGTMERSPRMMAVAREDGKLAARAGANDVAEVMKDCQGAPCLPNDQESKETVG